MAAPALEQAAELCVSPTGFSLCPPDHSADAVRDTDVLRARQRARLLGDGRGRGTCAAPLQLCTAAAAAGLAPWHSSKPTGGMESERQQSHGRRGK